jgi:hypothetical protein
MGNACKSAMLGEVFGCSTGPSFASRQLFIWPRFADISRYHNILCLIIASRISVKSAKACAVPGLGA